MTDGAQLRRLLDARDVARPFDKEIADTARMYRGKTDYELYYRLEENRNGIVSGTNEVCVYGYEDSCFLIGDELDPDAWSVSQFDVHELVRDILNETDYVLTYVDAEKLSESQEDTVFGEVFADG